MAALNMLAIVATELVRQYTFYINTEMKPGDILEILSNGVKIATLVLYHRVSKLEAFVLMLKDQGTASVTAVHYPCVDIYLLSKTRILEKEKQVANVVRDIYKCYMTRTQTSVLT